AQSRKSKVGPRPPSLPPGRHSSDETYSLFPVPFLQWGLVDLSLLVPYFTNFMAGRGAIMTIRALAETPERLAAITFGFGPQSGRDGQLWHSFSTQYCTGSSALP